MVTYGQFMPFCQWNPTGPSAYFVGEDQYLILEPNSTNFWNILPQFLQLIVEVDIS